MRDFTHFNHLEAPVALVTRLLPLLLLSAEGIGIFKTFGGVRRTGSDESGIQLDLTFYWPVRSSSEAKELDSVISGASGMYADRDSRDDSDPAKADYAVTRKFADDARHLTLNLIQDGTEGGRVILSDQGCSVVQAKVTTSKKAASYEVKVRVFGLTPKQVGQLAEGLTSHVGITLVTDQQVLFGAEKGKGDGKVVQLRTSIRPKVGQLVSGKLSGGEEFAGICESVFDDGMVNVMDFGVLHQISIAQVSSTLTVVPPKGKTMEWVEESYRTKAEKKGTRVSWSAILSALGEVHAQNLQPTESWTVSSSILDAAAKIDTSQAALPDDEEPEEVPDLREAAT